MPTQKLKGSSLVITAEDGDYQVWISLPGQDPREDRFGFIIGSGETRDAAVADAVASLEEATAALQGPTGTIEERDVLPKFARW